MVWRRPDLWITTIEAKGGYVNFTIDTTLLASKTIELILKNKKTYGHLKKKKKKIIIEHTSANPNGPLHVGRARNPIIGDTIVRIYKAAGYDVESQFYLDDMGKQVAILAWGINNIDPTTIPKTEYTKPDHISVGFYQQANKMMEKDQTVASAIGTIIKNLEQGESKTIDLVHNAYAKVLEGMNESLRRINITIDRYIPESNFVKDHSVDKALSTLKKTPYCYEEEGAYYLDVEPFGVQGRNTKFFLVRNDGTTLYATRDIAYHQWKATQADLLLNVLGEDHKLESKQVEIALQLLQTNTTMFLCGGPGHYYVNNKNHYDQLSNCDIYPIQRLGRMSIMSDFSKDLTKGTYLSGSVTIHSLQVAYYLGFDEVYLIGCDCDYSQSHHFDGKRTIRREAPVMSSQEGKHRVFKGYEICKRAFEKDGRKIYNATVGGKLEVFERRRLEDL